MMATFEEDFFASTMGWVHPSPRMPVANEGLGWYPVLKDILYLVVTITGWSKNTMNNGLVSWPALKFYCKSKGTPPKRKNTSYSIGLYITSRGPPRGGAIPLVNQPVKMG